MIDIQLKSTTASKVTITNGEIGYKLEEKTYNKLILRRDKGNVPLILILFILPEEREDWVKVKSDELLLRKHAFWFYPDSSATFTGNKSSITIKIPQAQQLDIDFFPDILTHFGLI